MKVFPLKTIVLGGKDVTYKELYKMCLGYAPINQQGMSVGFSYEDMRTRQKLEDKIDAATDTLELEDADAAQLKQMVATMRWASSSKEILAFGDEIAVI